MGYVTWPRPFQGHFAICRLGLAMFNPHIKFEMSTIICNEEMKGYVKCKNSRFEPPFGGLRSNAQGSSLSTCTIAILASSHGCGTIKLNQRFLKGWVTLRANFR